MSFTPLWSPTAFYNFGDTVQFQNNYWSLAVSGSSNTIGLPPQSPTWSLTTAGGGVASLNSLTGALNLAAGTNMSIVPSGGDTLTLNATAGGGVASLNSLTGALNLAAGTNMTIVPSGGNTLTLNASAPVYQATYYKSANQLLNGPGVLLGNTDITFDVVAPWSNTNGYITHISGSSNFTVVQTGLYFLEFNSTIIATSVAWTGSKSINIDITRPTIVEQAVIEQRATQNSGTDYGQSVSTTFYLVSGDVINLRVFNVWSSSTLTTTPNAKGLTSTFDLNTFFSWRFIA